MRYTRFPVTRQQARDMAEAHAEGFHIEIPRQGCPECEDRELGEYPIEKGISR